MLWSPALIQWLVKQAQSRVSVDALRSEKSHNIFSEGLDVSSSGGFGPRVQQPLERF